MLFIVTKLLKNIQNKYLNYLRKPKYKILYLSSHSVLEYDEVRILKSLGHFVFSPGVGRQHLRPQKILNSEEEKLKDQFSKLAEETYYKKRPLMRLFKLKSLLSKKFVSNFDIIIVMHYPEWIIDNWNIIKNKKVIWRSIGQSSPIIEKKLEPYRKNGLKIIRYSINEKNIANYIGCDEVIRFYKDDNEFSNWNGEEQIVLTVAQEIKKRHDACHYDIYKAVTKTLPSQLVGFGNEDVTGNVSELNYEELKEKLRNCRCFFYTGTYPAPYTLGFIEAWMTGIPIVAIGDKLMHDRFTNSGLYEIPKLIKNGYNGFCLNSVEEINRTLLLLLNNKQLANKISKNGKKTAIKYFGIKKITKQWKNFIKNKIWD